MNDTFETTRQWRWKFEEALAELQRREVEYTWKLKLIAIEIAGIKSQIESLKQEEANYERGRS